MKYKNKIKLILGSVAGLIIAGIFYLIIKILLVMIIVVTFKEINAENVISFSNIVGGVGGLWLGSLVYEKITKNKNNSSDTLSKKKKKWYQFDGFGRIF